MDTTNTTANFTTVTERFDPTIADNTTVAQINVTVALSDLNYVSSSVSDIVRDVLNTSSVYDETSPTPSTVDQVTPALPRTTPSFKAEGSLTGWITNTHNLTLIHGNYNLYVLYATFALMVTCVLLTVCWVQCRKRWLALRYERLLSTYEKDGEYMYKPEHGGILDEEYENTFVGVSIPILQDNSKV